MRTAFNDFFMKSEAFTECFMWWYCYSRFSWLWIFRSTRSTTYRSSLRLRIWNAVLDLHVLHRRFHIGVFLSKDKIHYLQTHFLFLLVSIPYLNIINYYDFTFSAEVTYFLRFIPLVRSGWALAIVVGWLTSNRASGLFVSYLTMLLAMVYFSSLIFFVIEQKVNPEVKDYNDALWWAFMDVTTVGSNIIAITPTGRILSVLLAALGMMMFPIFTVYVTSLVQSANKKKENYYNQTHPVSSGQASEAKPAGSTQTDK